MPEADWYMKTGDTAPSIIETLEDDTGTAVDLTNATIAFHMSNIAGGLALSAAAQNNQVGDGSDGSIGRVSYDWQAGDTATAGLYLAEWQVTFQGGEIETFPNGGYTLVRISSEVA